MSSKSGKTFLASFLIGVAISAALFFSPRVDSSEKPDSGRSIILGTPKTMKIDDTQGERKVIMSDPSIQKNWGLMGTQGKSDIKANLAWEITTGNRDVTVAIIDTGVDPKHPDLAGNLWRNPGETGIDSEGRDKSTNNKDDDENGLRDDVYGWDFALNTGKLTDNHGHGTHIAGILGAVGGNGVGITGVCPKVSMMILKYYDPGAKGNDNLNNTVRAIRYAVDKGAQIINYSGGGTEPNEEERKAIEYAQSKGVLFIAAAGNEKSNSDFAPYYPADYGMPNIISVTAIDSYARILKSSNYGIKTVHLAAPGEGIYSTLPNGQYGTMTGTSQATAFVSGVAALILSHNKTFNYQHVKDQIVKTSDEIPELRGKTLTGGKLNSYAALAILPNIPANGLASASIGSASNPAVSDASGVNQFFKALTNKIDSSAQEQAQNLPNSKKL